MAAMCRAIFVAAEEVQRFSRTLNSKILPYLGVGVWAQKEVSGIAPGAGSSAQYKQQKKHERYIHTEQGLVDERKETRVTRTE